MCNVGCLHHTVVCLLGKNASGTLEFQGGIGGRKKFGINTQKLLIITLHT